MTQAVALSKSCYWAHTSTLRAVRIRMKQYFIYVSQACLECFERLMFVSPPSEFNHQLHRHTGHDSTSFMTEDHLYREHLKCIFFLFNPIIFRFYPFPLFFFPCHISNNGSVIFTVLFGTCFDSNVLYGLYFTCALALQVENLGTVKGLFWQIKTVFSNIFCGSVVRMGYKCRWCWNNLIY